MFEVMNELPTTENTRAVMHMYGQQHPPAVIGSRYSTKKVASSVRGGGGTTAARCLAQTPPIQQYLTTGLPDFTRSLQKCVSIIQSVVSQLTFFNFF